MKKFKAIQIFIIMSMVFISVGLGLVMNSIGTGLVIFGISALVLAPLIFGPLNDDCF